MDSWLERNSKQASQAEPKIEEIETWDTCDLVNWIKQRAPKLLQVDDIKKLKRERVDGVVFLKHGGDKEYFRNDCNLAGGTSERLADLAFETMQQIGKEQDTSTSKFTDHAPLLFSLH